MVDHRDGDEALQNLFTEDGKPIRFLLDASIVGNQRRLGLRNKIQVSGRMRCNVAVVSYFLRFL